MFEISPQDLGERFFQELADFAPVMIWRSGTDGLCGRFDKPWPDFVGCSVEEEVGNGWAENVYRGGIVRDALDNGPAYARNARKLLSPKPAPGREQVISN